MNLDSIAYRITGMSKLEMLNYEPRQVYSSRDVNLGANPALYLGRLIFPEDMDRMRKQVRKNVPQCLKLGLLNRICSYLSK